MKLLVIFAASAWLGVAPAPASTPSHAVQIADLDNASNAQPNPALAGLLLSIAGADEAFRNADTGTARTVLEAVVRSATFSEAPGDVQRHVYELLASINFQAGDAAKGLEYAVRATALDGATGGDWSQRLRGEFATRDIDAAAASLTHLANNWPGALSGVPDLVVFDLATQTPNDDRQYQLLKALYSAQWKPKSRFLDLSPIWLRLATDLVDDGQADLAATVAQSITSPAGLILLHADRRFDALVAASPDRFDVGKGLDRQLLVVEADAAAEPDKLEGVNAVAAALLLRNQPENALALVDDAIAKARQSPGGVPPFVDAGDQLNWTFNRRNDVLALMGRESEALNALRSGAQNPERGRLNVSQTLNLAMAYDEAGRPKDALSALKDVGTSMSRIGLMVFHFDQACAYYQLHDQAHLTGEVNYLREHATDRPLSYLDALAACSDDDQALAQALIDRLEDKSTRQQVLLTLQTFLLSPHPSALEKVAIRRTKAMLERPAVKAEVDKVGRIQSYPIFEPPPPGT